MISEITKHIEDYYDHDVMSYIESEVKPIRKRFVIEYCDDKRNFELCGERKPGGGYWEIDDCYKSIVLEELQEENFHSLDGTAMELYLFYLFNPRIYDVKLWEQIWDEDEMIQERWIEFPATFYHEFAKVVSRDLLHNRDELLRRVDPLTKEIELFNEFLKKMNAEKTYKEWKEKRI